MSTLSEFAAQFPGAAGRLMRVRKSGNWAHAYLFTGDDPAFLERFALAWAQACACLSPAESGDACGVCRNCRLFAAGSYPGIFALKPESKSRQIIIGDLDKPRQRGVRHLIHELGLTADSGVLKAGIILEAETMNDQAQNAFLKTLEEPPRDTILLLTSCNPKKLLPTIRSRCQTVPLRFNRRDYAAAEKIGMFPILATLHPNAGAAAALAGSHALLSAFSTLSQEVGGDFEAAADPRLAEMAKDDKNLKKQLEEEADAALAAEYRRVRGGVLDALYSWFQQQLLLASGLPPDSLPHPEFFTASGGAPKPMTPEDADRACRLAAQLLQQLTGNVDERLAVEAFCLELCAKT